MAKKKQEPAVAEDEVSTAVALIEPAFNKLAEFKMPTVEESIAIIAKKREDNKVLVIDSVDDKVGYEAVKAAMAQMKNDRIAFVDAATENVINPANSYLKQFKADLEKIADEFKAGEKELRDKKDFIDGEKERLKAEAELKKVQSMQLRVNDLNVLGAIFDGAVYSFPYAETLMIGAGDIKDFSDDKYGEFLEEVKTAFAEEQTRLHEEKLRLDQEENERLLEIEQQKETARLQAEKDKQQSDKQYKLRQKELNLIGVESIDGGYRVITTGAIINNSHLIDLSEEDWDAQIVFATTFQEVPSEVTIIPDDEIPAFVKEFEGDAHPLDGGDFKSDDEEEDLYSAVASYRDNHPDEVKHTEVILRFNASEPFNDFDISGKLKMRIYPDVFKTEALAGVEVIANQGQVQGLNWIILSKGGK